MISILVLTYNEEVNLPGCLDSIQWCDDVVVFDSFSSDRTVEVAKAGGARVMQRVFDNYAAQRNAALEEVDYKYSWILMLDADERVTPELRKEIHEKLCEEGNLTALYRMRRKDMFCGRWLRRSSGYPTWFGRLMRVGKVRVIREINEEYHTEGKIGFLNEHLLHYPFNKGMSYWFERHNRYSQLEAEVLAQETAEPLSLKLFFDSDPVVRRKGIKQAAYRLPFRPALVFVYLYIIRLGFLDGHAGFTFSVLRSVYETMINVKMKEVRRRKKMLPV